MRLAHHLFRNSPLSNSERSTYDAIRFKGQKDVDVSLQQTSDEVGSVVEGYLAGFHTGDVNKLQQSFHPSCQLLALDSEGAVTTLSRDSWLAVVAGRQSPQSMGYIRKHEILAIDIANSKMASVKLKFTAPGRRFTDFLLLLKSAEGWRIISKSYTFESHEG